MRGASLSLTLIVLALLGSGIGTAQARPRDQVMAGAYRCSVIADSRIWLDCYSGAAQPAREALSLPPATSRQTALVDHPPAAGQPQDLSVRDAVMGEASRCNSLKDERGWLDCYYAAAKPMRALLGLPPAPQDIRPPMHTAAENSPLPSGNWLTGSSRTATSRMTSYTFGPTGAFTVSLANGQTWRQMPGDVRHPRWDRPAGSYVVDLSRGALGSVNFSVQGLPGLYKVELVH